MRNLLLGISMLTLVSGTGYAEGTQSCTLATKVGPFTSFKIEYKWASKVNVTLSYSKNSGSAGKRRSSKMSRRRRTRMVK